MNPNTPYNSGGLQNMVAKVRTYCSKIIPLVFDNTLSYYESICAFSAKVNELCDAVNAQNLTIVEFTHEVEIEIDRFEKYIQSQYDELNGRMQAAEITITAHTVRLNDLDDKMASAENAITDLQDHVQDIDSDIRDIKTDVTQLQTDMTDVNTEITSILNTLTQMRGTLSDLDDAVNQLQSDMADKVGWSDVVNHVVENNDHPVTSGAVYDAIQQGGGGGIVPDATRTSKGIVQIGDNINVSSGVISVPDASAMQKGVMTPGTGLHAVTGQSGLIALSAATANSIGGVKAGESLTVQNDGTLDADHATTSAFGTVKIGENLTTDVNGALKVKDAQAGTVKGAVTIDSMQSNMTLNNGVLDVPTGTTTNKGVLQVGNNLNVSNGVVSVPDAAAGTTKGVITTDNMTPNPLDITSGVLSLNIGDRLEVTNNALNAKKATVSQLGVVAPALNGAISVDSNGAIDVDYATTSKKGAVQLTTTFGSQQTGVVPTAAAVWNDFATKSTENFAVRADAPDASGNSQLYKIDAQGVRTNVNPLVQSGSITVNDATTTTKGIVQIGSNIDVSNGLISVPTAASGIKGVVEPAANSTIQFNNGEITCNNARPATAESGNYGTVRIGSTANTGLYIDGTSYELGIATASNSQLGGVKVGSNLAINQSGVLSVPYADSSTYGAVTITSTVTSGSTAVPTSAAVYNAIQGGAIRYVVPNAVQTNTDDIFISSSADDTVNPDIAQSTVYNKNFKPAQNYIWLKNSAFGIDDTKNVASEFYSKFILNILPLSYGNNVACLISMSYSAAYPGHTVIFIENGTKCVITLMLQ